jgi:hypothetical protein
MCMAQTASEISQGCLKALLDINDKELTTGQLYTQFSAFVKSRLLAGNPLAKPYQL